jgi:polysaccharide biosynthesis/export protein
MPFRHQRLFRRGYLATGDTEHYKGRAMIYDELYIQKRHEAVFADVLRRRVLRTLIRSHVACVFAVFVLLLCGGCQTASLSPLPEQPTSKTPVTLSPGDVIKLSFPGTPDLDQLQRIRTDGKVSLPLLGEVTAAGKTLPAFQSELVRLYKPQLRNSEVVVTLESGIMQVVVSGAVAKPQKLQFDRPTTVFQAIMEAGGVNDFGNLKKVRLIRTIKGLEQSQILDLSPTLRGEKTQAFYIKDGDVIFVPQSVF